MKRTKKLTLCAILSALAVVLLWLGKLLDVLDLSAAALASFFVVFLFMELGLFWAVMHWGVTAALALIVASGSGAPLFYAVFGLYPVLKAYLERMPRIAEWVLKLIVCNVTLAAYILLAKYVFLLSDTALSGKWLWVFILLANVVFVLYDIALSRLITFYSLRLRRHFLRFLR